MIKYAIIFDDCTAVSHLSLTSQSKVPVTFLPAAPATVAVIMLTANTMVASSMVVQTLTGGPNVGREGMVLVLLV